jgi:sugar lactone lactonase YvrE
MTIGCLVLGSSSVRAGYQLVQTIGTKGTGEGQFTFPSGLAVDSIGNVWVADTYNSRIQEFSSTGEFIKSIGSAGVEEAQFNFPTDVAVDSGGNIWVADSSNNRIQQFDSNGSFIKQFSTGPDPTDYARSVAVDNAGNVWVTKPGKILVQQLSNDGAVLQEIDAGAVDGGSVFFGYLTVDGLGNALLADGGRILKFNSSGEYVTAFGTGGTDDGQFRFAHDVAVDSLGNMWVADTNNNRIQQLDANGAYLSQIALPGGPVSTGPYPIGVAVDGDNNVWVVDMYKHSLLKYSFVVPEPSTYALAAIGAVTLLAVRRRKRPLSLN